MGLTFFCLFQILRRPVVQPTTFKAPNIHQICQILLLKLYVHQRDNIFTKIQIILICILTFLLFLLVFKNLIQFLNLIIPGSTHSICFVVVVNIASGREQMIYIPFPKYIPWRRRVEPPAPEKEL